MNRLERLSPAAWPCVVVIACLLLATGCQDGSGPNLVTSPEGKPAYEGAKPPPTPADPAIAYIEQRSGHANLKVMNADGSNVTTIHTSNSIFFGSLGSPSWSPDGHSIAFIDGAAGTGNLWRIDVAVVNGVPQGTNRTMLLDRSTSIAHPAWAPRGDQIAFADLTLRTIEVIPAAGGTTSVLYTWPESIGIGLAWSPDASKIAFASPSSADASLYTLDVNNQAVALALGPGWTPVDVDWARTQDVLAFRGPEGRIYTLQLPSGTPTLLVEGFWATWSPDDREILFENRFFRKVNLATGLITTLRTDGKMPDWRRSTGER